MYNASSTGNIPCAICSSRFDPLTLPAHVYDPYNAFFTFPDHSSICPSCFAEELAKRTRRPSNDAHSTTRPSMERPGTSSDVVIRLSGSQIGEGEGFERSDSGAAFVSEGGGRQVYGHRKTGSITTISRSASTSRLGAHSSLPASRRNSRSQPDLHRRGMSVDQIRKSMETPVRHARSTPPQRHSPPLASQPIPEFWQTGPPIAGPYTTSTPRPSTSRYSPQEMTATSIRYSPPTPSTATMGTQRPSTGHDSATLNTRKSTDTKESREAKKEELMRRKVSFRQGTPVPKAYHPMAPPSSSAPPLNIPGEIPLGPMVRGESYEVERAELAQVETAEPAPQGFIARWRSKRRRRKEERTREKAEAEARQIAKREREDAEKGIGLDIFCPSCRIVVQTSPDWTEGTCCMITLLTTSLCLGPLSLSLLHPSCSPYIKDVNGICPHCSTVLASWKRRTNSLTLHSWQGFADPTAQPLDYPSNTMFGRSSTRPSTAAEPRPSTSSRRPATSTGVIRATGARSGARGRAGTVGTTGTHGTYLTSSSSNAAPTTGSSNLAGSSNTASSGADTFGDFGASAGQSVVFRDARTGELVVLESVGRAIG